MIQLLKKSPNCVQYLEKIRINPKLTKNKGYIRADLEFYIPQILAQYLRSDLEPDSEKNIEKFILNACEINIFFAHKIWFNLRASLINKEDNDQIMKIFQLTSEIKTMIEKSQEKLYMANSNALLKLIKKCNLLELLNEDLKQILKK